MKIEVPFRVQWWSNFLCPDGTYVLVIRPEGGAYQVPVVRAE